MLNRERSKSTGEHGSQGAPVDRKKRNQDKTLIVLGTIITLAGLVLYSTTMTLATESLVSEQIGFLTEGLCLIGIGAIIGVIGTNGYLKAVLETSNVDDFF